MIMQSETPSNPRHIEWDLLNRFELSEELAIELETSLKACLDLFTQDYSIRVRCWHHTGAESWWPSLAALILQQQHATNPIDRLEIEIVSPAQEDFAKFRHENEYHEGLLHPEDTLAGSIEMHALSGRSKLVFRSRINFPVLKEIEKQVIPILERAYSFLHAPDERISFPKPLTACFPWLVWIGSIFLLQYVPYIGSQKLGELTITGFGIWMLVYVGISAFSIWLSGWSPKRSKSPFDREGHFVWGDYGKCRHNHLDKRKAFRSTYFLGFGLFTIIGGIIVAYAKDFLDGIFKIFFNR